MIASKTIKYLGINLTKGVQVYTLNQVFPTPRPWTSTGPQPVRNQAAQQEVSGRRGSKTSSATPHRSPSFTLPPEPSLALPPETSPHTPPQPHVWKNCLSQNQSLVPKSLGTTALNYKNCWMKLKKP